MGLTVLDRFPSRVPLCALNLVFSGREDLDFHALIVEAFGFLHVYEVEFELCAYWDGGVSLD